MRANLHHLNIWVDDETVVGLDEVTRALSARAGGIAQKRSDVTRAALKRGLKALADDNALPVDETEQAQKDERE